MRGPRQTAPSRASLGYDPHHHLRRPRRSPQDQGRVPREVDKKARLESIAREEEIAKTALYEDPFFCDKCFSLYCSHARAAMERATKDVCPWCETVGSCEKHGWITRQLSPETSARQRVASLALEFDVAMSDSSFERVVKIATTIASIVEPIAGWPETWDLPESRIDPDDGHTDVRFGDDVPQVGKALAFAYQDIVVCDAGSPEGALTIFCAMRDVIDAIRSGNF